MPILSEWESFYVIVGSSAGALIGLQFVVIALIADMPRPRGSAQATSAFSTPSVVHFAVVLLLAAILSAPWHGIGKVAIVWAVIGIAGIAYDIIVARRLRSQTAYKPVFEDWLFHVLLPLAAYALLTVSAVIARSYARRALFVVAGSTLLLLFVGIHNAWDAVTYLVFVHRDKPAEVDDAEQGKDQE
jgi:hypothetical protein